MPVAVANTLSDLTDGLVDVNDPMSYEINGDLIEADVARSWEFLGNMDPTIVPPESSSVWSRPIEMFGGALVQDYFHDIIGATKKIIEKARDAKSPPPAMVVVPANSPRTSLEESILSEVTIFGHRDVAHVLGLEASESNASAFPLTEKLYSQFRGGNERKPKFVRLDTVDSYRDFRASSPDIEELRQRIADVEAMFSRHVSDGHGGAFERLCGEVNARKRVPLSMPPWAEGKWDCWQEGDLVCCSIALPGHDGEIRICTSATPVVKHGEDVLGWAAEVGCRDVTPMLGVLPTIACMLGGGSLMPEMAAAAPALLSRPEARGKTPFIGRMIPANHPTLATLIALLQHAQSGDPQALEEWQKLSSLSSVKPELAQSMIEAQKRLADGQRKKESKSLLGTILGVTAIFGFAIGAGI